MEIEPRAVSPLGIRLLHQRSKVTANQLSKFSVPAQFCLISLPCPKYFARGLSYGSGWNGSDLQTGKFSQSLMHVSIVTLFQAISGFKNNSHKSEWDGGDLRTCNFSWLDDITVSVQSQVLKTVKNPSHGSAWD